MITGTWRRLDLKLVAVIISLLVSAYCFLLPGLPNDDAYVYVRTAEIFLDSGVGAAFTHYGWATYSVLIGSLSRLGPTLFASGHLLNALFFALLVYAFLAIVEFFDGRKSVTALAVLTILLYPELNEFRFYLIRDVAFWALALVAIWQLLLYRASSALRHGVAFVISLSLAALFRAEALLYLLLLPLSLLIDPALKRCQRRQSALPVIAMSYGVTAVIAVGLWVTGIDVFELLARFFSVYLPFVESTFNPDPERNAQISRLLFGDHAAIFSSEYLPAVLAVGLLAILFFTFFNGLGAYFWILLYGLWRGRISIQQLSERPVLLAMLINAIILIVFLYLTRYLSSRYAILLCLLLATQVPVVVMSILERTRGSKWQWRANVFLLLFFLYCFFDAYTSFGDDRDYLLEAAAFASTEAGESGAVITNNHSIAYFSGLVTDYDEVPRAPSEDRLLATGPEDVIILEMVPELSDLLENEALTSQFRLQASFPDSDNPIIQVFRRLPE